MRGALSDPGQHPHDVEELLILRQFLDQNGLAHSSAYKNIHPRSGLAPDRAKAAWLRCVYAGLIRNHVSGHVWSITSDGWAALRYGTRPETTEAAFIFGDHTNPLTLLARAEAADLAADYLEHNLDNGDVDVWAVEAQESLVRNLRQRADNATYQALRVKAQVQGVVAALRKCCGHHASKT